MLSLYWAVLFHAEQNLGALVIWVVDFDGQVAPYQNVDPVVGPAIVKYTEMLASSPMAHLGWGALPPSHFNNDPMEVRRQVYHQKAWGAVIVNANATAMLRSAVENGNASYDPLGACQTIYVEARDDTSYYDYILPELSMVQTEMTTQVGQMWAKSVLSNNTLSRATLAKVPQAISPAIGFSTFNLRPFYPPVAVPAVSIGLIYLIIIAFFSFSFFMPLHMSFVTPGKHPPLKFRQLIAWRWISTVTAYLIMSLFYSLISLAFQIPFSNPPGTDTDVATNANAYGRATFVVYWMVNFVGMTALGLACENVAMIVGQPWTALWLVFWVITNVATAFYAIELAPRFYYWGYAWPLHNIVEASRQLIFDLHSRIGLNFGVLFAWCAINTLLFPFCCYFMRWKTMRSKRKEQEAKQKE